MEDEEEQHQKSQQKQNNQTTQSIKNIGQSKLIAKKLKNKKKTKDQLISEFLNKDNEPQSPNHNEKEENIKKTLEKKFTAILKIRKQITQKQQLLNKANINGKNAKIQKEEKDEIYTDQPVKKMGFFEKSAKKMRLGSFLEGFGLGNGEEFDFNKATDISILASTLQKPHQERTERQQDILSSAIKQTDFYKFYEDIFQKDHEVYKKVLSHMHYQSYDKYEYVMHQGYSCRFIYIILSGSCIELIPDVSISEEQLQKDVEYFNSIATFNSDKQGGELEQIGNNLKSQQFKNNEAYLESINPGFKVFRKLKKQQYFGDTFVRYRTITKFTVQCIQNMQVAILPLEKYHHFIDISQSIKYTQEHGFFQNCGVLRSFQEFDVEIMYRHCERRELKLGNVVYKQGDSPVAVYIIVNGEIEIASLISIQPDKTYDNTHHFLQSVYIEERNRQLFKQSKVLKGQTQTRRTIALLGVGQSFGEDELLQNMPRQQEAICKSSSAVVLVIDRNLYINLLSSLGQTRIYNKKSDLKLSDKQIWRSKLINQIIDVETKIQQNQISQKDIHKNEEYKQHILDMVEDPTIKLINQSNNTNVLSSKNIQNQINKHQKENQKQQMLKNQQNQKLLKNPKYNAIKSKINTQMTETQIKQSKNQKQLEEKLQKYQEKDKINENKKHLISNINNDQIPNNTQIQNQNQNKNKEENNNEKNQNNDQQQQLLKINETQESIEPSIQLSFSGINTSHLKKRTSYSQMDQRKISMTRNGQASFYSKNYGKNYDIEESQSPNQNQNLQQQQLSHRNSKIDISNTSNQLASQQLNRPSLINPDTNSTIQNSTILQLNTISSPKLNLLENTYLSPRQQQYAQTTRASMISTTSVKNQFNFGQQNQSTEIQGSLTQRQKKTSFNFNNETSNKNSTNDNNFNSILPEIQSNKSSNDISQIQNYFDKYTSPRNQQQQQIINNNLQHMEQITQLYQLQQSESKKQLSQNQLDELKYQSMQYITSEAPKLTLKQKRAKMESQNTNLKLIPIESDEKVFNEHTQKYLNQLDMHENKCKKGQSKFKPFLNYDQMKNKYTYITTENYTHTSSQQEEYDHEPVTRIPLAKSSQRSIETPFTRKQSVFTITDVDPHQISLTSRNKEKQYNTYSNIQYNKNLNSPAKRKLKSKNDFNKNILYQSLNLQKILPDTPIGQEAQQFNKKLKIQLKEQHQLLAQEADIKSRKQNLPGHVTNKMKPGQQPLKVEDFEKDIPNSKSFTSKEKYIFCQYLDNNDKKQQDQKIEFANFIIPKKLQKSQQKSQQSDHQKSPTRRFGLSSSATFNFKRQVSLYNSQTTIKDKDGSPTKKDSVIILESKFDDLTPKTNSLISQVNINVGSQISYTHRQTPGNNKNKNKKSQFLKQSKTQRYNNQQFKNTDQPQLKIKSSANSLHEI